MKTFMTEHGPIDKVYINDYQFADRLLEDVYFECVIEDNKIKVLGPIKIYEKYFEQFNKQMWMTIAQNYAENNDIFNTSDNEEAWIAEV